MITALVLMNECLYEFMINDIIRKIVKNFRCEIISSYCQFLYKETRKSN